MPLLGPFGQCPVPQRYFGRLPFRSGGGDGCLQPSNPPSLSRMIHCIHRHQRAQADQVNISFFTVITNFRFRFVSRERFDLETNMTPF